MPIRHAKYQPIIGLEVHAQLLTQSKIFCNCSTKFGAKENSQVCPICLGMPGVLPVLNKKAVEFAIKMGLATNCQISAHSLFARKNYFYPDLPKGYQISQYDAPLCYNGYVEIELDDKIKKIGIIRIHLEEDAGKSIHAGTWINKNESLIDLNRCGVPLVEIVSKPEIRSPREAYLYLSALRQILLYLEICDGNMEQGSLRCDANVSVRSVGDQQYGIKTELKNMNSFHGVEKALTYEIDRQILLIASGKTVQQETLLWDANKNIATPMRTKEESPDYRYFPEPDLVPININQHDLDEIRAQLPELPLKRRNRFIAQDHLPKYDADILTENKIIADFYEQAAKLVPDSKLVSNWIMGEVLHKIKEQQDSDKAPIPGTALAELLNLIIEGTISEKIAKDVFKEMASSGKSAQSIVKEKDLAQISDPESLVNIISEVIEDNPCEVLKYQAGKTKLFGYFVGQVMEKTRGKANPHLVNKLLHEKLSSS
jgi:aspartyl-tRNA(Asn)/glutamyl-tRNA(Gln) amidotransferase subunit B